MMIPFDNSYARLPERLFSRVAPEPVAAPALIRVNRELAAHLGIDADWLASPAGVNVLAGNRVPAGAQPIAAAYAGHQFGGWNPQLGDGRALLLGEVIDRDGRRRDIQLKGSGRTPYSRMGDGRAPLGPVLREYLVSEAMATLGVPTTRALAAVTTGETVRREEDLPGAVLARVASSHIRVGTFQLPASRGDHEGLRALAEHVICRHYPAAGREANPVLAMLAAAVGAQATLIARWQALGFIHGVMNTDNMLLSGETVDYGPCAFMDQFDPAAVFSSIDRGGRYAYRNQPAIGQWNLAALAQALLPILHRDEDEAVALAQASVDGFAERFLDAQRQVMGRKLGLRLAGAADECLVRDLLVIMEQAAADFTLTFRHLADLAHPRGQGQAVAEVAAGHIPTGPAWEDWLERWRVRSRADDGNQEPASRQRAMDRANPALIPRNHQVAEVLAAAQEDGDFAPFHALAEVLANPFEFRPELAPYATPPRPEQVVRQTFCGT